MPLRTGNEPDLNNKNFRPGMNATILAEHFKQFFALLELLFRGRQLFLRLCAFTVASACACAHACARWDDCLRACVCSTNFRGTQGGVGSG